MVFYPLPMVFRTPYPWYFDPRYPRYLYAPTHGIWTPLPMAYWTPYRCYFYSLTYGVSNPLSTVYWTPVHGILTSTHGILTPLTNVCSPPTRVISTPYPWQCYLTIHGILNPYPWYFYPLPMVFLPLTHGILTPAIHNSLIPLHMVFWIPYPWYIETNIQVTLTRYPWCIEPLSMVYGTPYPWYSDTFPWYFNPYAHGILTPFPYFDHCPWYFNPPTHGVSNSLSMVYWTP
jgi:hypothetical protein